MVERQLKCQKNLKEITLAMHTCHDSNDKLPPSFGTYGSEVSEGTIFFYMLPYLEQKEVYNRAEKEKGVYSVWTGNVYSQDLRQFECPSDGQAGKRELFQGWLATGSYAANYLIFGSEQGRPLGSITDGTSNRIAFAERYQICSDTPCGWAYNGDSEWAPVFAYSSWRKFQIINRDSTCNPQLPQAMHVGSIHVAMADGSLRVVTGKVSDETWYNACVPAGGQPLGDDF
jgi:hypothetical protein